MVFEWFGRVWGVGGGSRSGDPWEPPWPGIKQETAMTQGLPYLEVIRYASIGLSQPTSSIEE